MEQFSVEELRAIEGATRFFGNELFKFADSDKFGNKDEFYFDLANKARELIAEKEESE